MLTVVDNYDSFTYNLVQLFEAAGEEIRVVRNDELSADEILAARPRGVVLSPGPGRPEGAAVTVDLVARRPRIPILGVCLGHQVLAQEFGATVARAPEPVHGKTASVEHAGDPLFRGVPSPFEATRYHSLHVEPDSLPDELVPIAHGPDGVLMALRHGQLPYWGVQFHPESILTPHGPRIVANFLELVARFGDSEVEPATSRELEIEH